MTRFDRYVLSQLMMLFGFFTLVLVAIYWINRTVRLVSQLIEDGQSVGVIVELTVLNLPYVTATMLPMGAFAAAGYVTNRMSNESELVVMQTFGFSPFRMARPVLVFGLIVALMAGLLEHFLVPASTERMRQREAEVSSNATAKLLSKGTFRHPTRGVTFFIREITPDGILQDVLLSDRRDPETTMIYTAPEAYLTRSGPSINMIMVDGLSQGYDRKDNTLFTAHFTDFTYDISALINRKVKRVNSVEDLTTPRLMRDPASVMRTTGVSPGTYAIELHDRFNQSLIGIVAALIGFSTLLLGGFSRFGLWRQVVGAVGLLIVIRMTESAITDPVSNNATLWPLVYMPSAVGFAIVTGLLFWMCRPRRLRALDHSSCMGQMSGETEISQIGRR